MESSCHTLSDTVRRSSLKIKKINQQQWQPQTGRNFKKQQNNQQQSLDWNQHRWQQMKACCHCIMHCGVSLTPIQLLLQAWPNAIHE